MYSLALHVPKNGVEKSLKFTKLNNKIYFTMNTAQSFINIKLLIFIVKALSLLNFLIINKHTIKYNSIMHNI